jgi:hypothetical protein
MRATVVTELPKGYQYIGHCSMVKKGVEKTEGARIANAREGGLG